MRCSMLKRGWGNLWILCQFWVKHSVIGHFLSITETPWNRSVLVTFVYLSSQFVNGISLFSLIVTRMLIFWDLLFAKLVPIKCVFICFTCLYSMTSFTIIYPLCNDLLAGSYLSGRPYFLENFILNDPVFTQIIYILMNLTPYLWKWTFVLRSSGISWSLQVAF